MLEFGMTNLMIFFGAILAGLVFVIAWIVNSELRINACRKEIARLKSQFSSIERENFLLAEEASSRGKGPRKDEFERENEKLRGELSEAKSSLEEVYKALLSQK